MSSDYRVNNDIFADNSWYFRNALVRANYNDLGKGISATTIYLERFFENLLMGYQNELKNRYIHVDYKEQSAVQSATEGDSKCNNCTLEELAILKELQKNPSITQKNLLESLVNLREPLRQELLKCRGRVLSSVKTGNAMADGKC